MRQGYGRFGVRELSNSDDGGYIDDDDNDFYHYINHDYHYHHRGNHHDRRSIPGCTVVCQLGHFQVSKISSFVYICLLHF